MKMLTREAADVRTAEGLQPSRMWFSDLIFEAFAGIFARPGRMVMTILGTMIGLTALVATLGLSRTASAQIISRFDELAATEITVSSRPAGEGQPANELPWDASERIRRLNGSSRSHPQCGGRQGRTGQRVAFRRARA
jgi:hypothetical protein